MGKIKLTWDADKEPDIAGYKVYYGTTPGKYGPGIDVGNVTKYTLEGLVKKQTYYVAIKAYTRPGKESPFSQEVSGVAK
jgi:fibronectin type 3 domain-containing protein